MIENADAVARKNRWNAPGNACVTHPAHGTVIVPCKSKLAAIICAADVWRCDFSEIIGASVMMAEPWQTPLAMPLYIMMEDNNAE